MKLDNDLLAKLLRSVKKTLPDELGCDDCFDELHRFAELKLRGEAPEKAMPMIREHLDRCGECRQEYEALLEAIKALRVIV